MIRLVIVLLLISCPALAQSGVASYYGGSDGFCGKKTASGERFNCGAFTAAHKTLPFGTKVKVTYKGRSIVVRINDRGPFVAGRVIDLSPAAHSALGMPGTAPVTLEVMK